MRLGKAAYRCTALAIASAFGAVSTLHAVATARGAGALPLRFIADIPLPGSASRLDYQSLDPARGLLFVAHLGDSSIIAVDIRRRTIAAVVTNVADVHGVLAVPREHTVYATATGADEAVALDAATLRIRWRSAAGSYPDGLAYDPSTRHLFVSDEKGGTETVLDARTGRHIATIALNGEVGNTQYDERSGLMWVNAEGAGRLVAVDPRSNRVVRSMPLPGCEGNHGLAIDAAENAFVACENNARLLRIDLTMMRVRGDWRVGGEPDVLAIDGASHVLYVASESGIVALFRDAPIVTPIASAYLAYEAHTVAAGARGTTYWPLQDIRGRPVLRIMRCRC